MQPTDAFGPDVDTARQETDKAARTEPEPNSASNDWDPTVLFERNDAYGVGGHGTANVEFRPGSRRLVHFRGAIGAARGIGAMGRSGAATEASLMTETQPGHQMSYYGNPDTGGQVLESVHPDDGPFAQDITLPSGRRKAVAGLGAGLPVEKRSGRKRAQAEAREGTPARRG